MNKPKRRPLGLHRTSTPSIFFVWCSPFNPHYIILSKNMKNKKNKKFNNIKSMISVALQKLSPVHWYLSSTINQTVKIHLIHH